MKNNFLNILGTACLVLFLGSSITSCSVEDGIDGTNGIDGLNGSDGADGVDGSDGLDGLDGADAIGLEEFAKYGSIELRVQGTRPDSVAFDQETALEFISPELYYNSFQKDRSDLEFEFLRLVNAPNVDQVNGVEIKFVVGDPGLPSQDFDFDIEFSEFAIFSDDLKYISLSDYFSGTPQSIGDDNNNNTDRVDTNDNNNSPNIFSVSDYSFEDSTNNLKFSFTIDVPADNNQTGNDLSISGEVNVIVFENVNSRD